MSHTNSTTNYSLPQFISTDTPGWLTDVNSAMSDIDAAIYARQTSIATNSNDIASLGGRMTNAEGDITNLDADINTPTTGLKDRMTAAENDITNNANNIATNTGNISALNTAVSNIQAARSVITGITLAAASWSGGYYTISDTDVTAKSVIEIGLDADPTSGEVAEWMSAQIVPGVVTAGTGFTIKAMGNAPSIDINVVYVRTEAV